MKFLCDVHISYKLSAHLISLGFESHHVNEILNKSETKDSEICRHADLNDLIVITKDADFRDFFFIKSTSKKLIKVNLGNVSNNRLIEIFASLVGAISELNRKTNFLLEIDPAKVSWLELK